ncbi:hypothetical protein PI124_g9168 [Phytophthora idaei]|nr:hypothetical protein PI125_g11624 [Phytophthora idaei]KAG3137784.1 hypothetical protein PI126_g17219 [Phytophthora idaei]KAG3246098.1 hypothetical protein PI124_g9168 [Phytophthora idaei]
MIEWVYSGDFTGGSKSQNTPCQRSSSSCLSSTVSKSQVSPQGPPINTSTAAAMPSRPSGTRITRSSWCRSRTASSVGDGYGLFRQWLIVAAPNDSLQWQRSHNLIFSHSTPTPIRDFAPSTADLGSCAPSTSRPNLNNGGKAKHCR